MRSQRHIAIFLLMICNVITAKSYGQTVVELTESEARRGIEIFDYCDKVEAENEVLVRYLETVKAERDLWKQKYSDKQSESEMMRLAIIEKDKALTAQSKIIDLTQPKRRVLAGGEVGTDLQKGVLKANVDFQTKKGNIFGIGIDTRQFYYVKFTKNLFTF